MHDPFVYPLTWRCVMAQFLVRKEGLTTNMGTVDRTSHASRTKMESITRAIRDLHLGEPVKASEALIISDIVRVILRNMGQDWPTLYRAIRLNKMWYKQGIGLLWERSPAFASSIS